MSRCALLRARRCRPTCRVRCPLVSCVSSRAGAAMGVCASPDGVALPVGPTVPVPTAYFPLTNGSTYSWPIPEYWAYNTSTMQSKKTKFVQDSYFGTVVQCNATAGACHFDAPARLHCVTG